MAIHKILVANRGEIAVRIIRAGRELGKKVVSVYAHDDRFLPHVFWADDAYPLLGKSVTETYLDQAQIIRIAKRAKVQAIHPGYGFLAENASFARACRQAGIIFIGPLPETIETMGEKIAAKEAMRAGGVPVIPGSRGAVGSATEAEKIAGDVGYPVLLKAVFGGGGRGMRLVKNKKDLEQAFLAASREAQAAFGDGSLYVEKCFEKARHIEVQLLADHHGNILHLGERECSIQRRHQKLCEEALAARLTQAQRKELYEMAVAGAKAVNYRNAGTMEFILDRKGRFYFMEMNTRLQVEHPVTEAVTGIDLARWQIRIAEGEKLQLKQAEIKFCGHAIEFRINAEDPFQKFLPSPGKVVSVTLPSGAGIRVDTFLYPFLQIPERYDSLVAKLIVWAKNRELCLRRAAQALEQMHIRGITTTIPFHLALLKQKWFKAGKFHVGSLEERAFPLGPCLQEEELAAIAFALYHGTASSYNHQLYVSEKWKRAARLASVQDRL